MNLDTDVVVVGAGPVGLTLGMDLAWRGRKAVVLEERLGPVGHPKATLLGARSMEFYRRWDLADAIYGGALPPNERYAIIFCTRLAGTELHRFASPSIAETRDRRPGTEDRWPELRWSPYGKTQIGQQKLEPILLDHAKSLPDLDLRHGHRFNSFEDRGDHVVVEAENVATGEKIQLRSEYLVGCDGGGSSIRKALGARFGGRGPWRANVSYFFRSPEFLEVHGKGIGNLYFIFAPDAFGVFTAIDGHSLWNYQLYFLNPSKETENLSPEEVLARAVGKPFEFELLETTHWQHHQSVADRWRGDRVFIAGDAAHLFAPTGGVGMNTGICDACDLAWKLDGVISGWGGPELLDSYEKERRPVAWRNSQRSMTNSDAIDFVMGQVEPGVEDDTAEGEARRTRLRDNIRWMARQFNSAGVHLGHRYHDSPVIVPDGTDEPPDDFATVTQSTWPGSRAPHVWLADGRSTLDWYGKGFVVVVTDANKLESAGQLQAALADRGAEARTELCTEPAVIAAYERSLVLVRPDGHVCWRGEAVPSALRDVVATVCGG